MKRRIFFWLERLKITPAERKAVSTLLIILVILGSLNMALTPSIPFGGEHYLELEKQFRERTAMLKTKEKALMKRYYPKEKREVSAVLKDTLPSDNSPNADAKTHADTSAVLINVNNADQKALESLPGIGPAYAGRIIKYRQEHEKFNTVEELKKIKGIGEKRLDKLKPLIKLKE